MGLYLGLHGLRRAAVRAFLDNRIEPLLELGGGFEQPLLEL